MKLYFLVVPHTIYKEVLRMYIVIPELCIVCGACYEICQHDAIMYEGVAVIDQAKCCECGECQKVCQIGTIRSIDFSNSADVYWK